jgi:hypothetical protein
MDIRTAALVVGLALATFKIVSACVVYLRTQVFGMAGVSLVGGGILLVGLSVWSATALKVSEQGFELITEVQQDLVHLSEANRAVSQQLLSVAQRQELAVKQTASLTEVIEKQLPAAALAARTAEDTPKDVPAVDLGKLERLSRGTELASRRALARRTAHAHKPMQ